jgi:phytoene synthase
MTPLLALIARGDPTRFAALQAAPPQARAALVPLYAFNLEISRAPWVSKEPMVAEMRLQWWRDAAEDLGRGIVRGHEVLAPLAEVIDAQHLPLEVLDRMIEARRWDIYSEPFEDQSAMDAYLDDTAGGLMWLSGKALGGRDEAALRDYGWAMGLASYLQAVPELAARGRIPLLDGRDSAIALLAQRGLDRLARARKAGIARSIRPALLAGWQTQGLLRMAVQDPGRVGDAALQLSEFSRRGGLLVQAFTGRW